MGRFSTGAQYFLEPHGLDEESGRFEVGHTKPSKKFLQELQEGSSDLSTSEPVLLYGLGQAAHADSVEVRWPSGRVQTLADVWRWISAPEREPFLRLFFEVYVGALGRAEAGPLVRDWLEFLRTRWRLPVDEATATLMVAVVRGLLLDLLATGDSDRTDAALKRFSEVVEAS